MASELRTVVMCPMAMEHRAVVRAVRAAGLDRVVDVWQIGVGARAVERAVERAGEQVARGGGGGAEPAARPVGARGARVIMAGTCGGLRVVEDVPRIGRVVDEHGGAWETEYSGERGAVTLVGVDRIVSTPEEKRTLSERTGAAIVDMESHAFCRACEAMGLSWAVVRGVSDTPEETLPGEVIGWITPAGGTRYGRAMLDLVRRPRLMRDLRPVMRRAGRVLPRVGEAVVEVVRSRHRAPGIGRQGPSIGEQA